MRTNNAVIFTNADMSTTLHSTPYLVDQIYGYSVQIEWTGSPNGTFILEMSNDLGIINSDGTVSGVTNWTTISNSSNAISAAGTLAYNVNWVYYRWFRVTYTASSGGTSTLNGRVQSKGF